MNLNHALLVLPVLFLMVACSDSDGGGGTGAGGAGGSSPGTGGSSTTGTGGSGTGAGGGNTAWSFDYCERHLRGCPTGSTCEDSPCYQSECGGCACGDPGCYCSRICECEPSDNGGTCVPSDYVSACAEYADTAACQADARCRWVVPGCGATEPPGCHPAEDCGETWCGAGKACRGVLLTSCDVVHLCVPVSS